MTLSETFLEHFEPLSGPRTNNHNLRHNLEDILTITILGSICGADTWTEICEFAEAKKTWLSGFLELLNGIPLVSAWATQQRIILSQVKTEEKSNEIEAMPRLLKMIDIAGSIVTMDAMGCQKDIAKCIVQKEADYVMSLKDNQPTLAADVQSIFKQGEKIQYKKMLNRRKVEKVRNHGRVETRKYTLISARDPLLFELRWPGLKSIGKLEVTRTVNNEVAYSTRYFLTSAYSHEHEHPFA